jgi:hypothetical protein
VFDGAIPYVFVKIKFVGLKAVCKLLLPNGKPNPTLSGFGIIISSVSPTEPAPNCNCNEPLILLQIFFVLLLILINMEHHQRLNNYLDH